MLKIAIVLVHDKSVSRNQAQLNFLKSILSEIRVIDLDQNNRPILDEQTNLPNDRLIGYTINKLPISHQAQVYQIIPYGGTPPPNMYEIDSYKVYYRKGDEDKTKGHPRFFNWGLKRATDYGADFVIFLDNHLLFDVVDLKVKLIPLANPNDKTIFTESPWGKIGSLELLTRVGQLSETKKLTAALTEYKHRITTKGYRHG